MRGREGRPQLGRAAPADLEQGLGHRATEGAGEDADLLDHPRPRLLRLGAPGPPARAVRGHREAGRERAEHQGRERTRRRSRSRAPRRPRTARPSRRGTRRAARRRVRPGRATRSRPPRPAPSPCLPGPGAERRSSPGRPPCTAGARRTRRRRRGRAPSRRRSDAAGGGPLAAGSSRARTSKPWSRRVRSARTGTAPVQVSGSSAPGAAEHLGDREVGGVGPAGQVLDGDHLGDPRAVAASGRSGRRRRSPR